MPRELFRDVVSPHVRVQTGSRYTMLLSVVAHVLIVAAVVIVPLMATGVMPPLASDDLPFILAAPTPAPPPLPTPPAAATAPAPVVNPNAAPTVAPDKIRDELPRPVIGADVVDGAVPILGPPTNGFGPGVGVGRDVSPVPPPPPTPQAPVRIGGSIREPVKVKNVPPVYPQIAIAARVEGLVIIEAVIGTDGAVRETRILRGVPLLNQAALDAVKQWQYTPTMLNNVPVPVIMTVTVQFKLQ